jgi:hypothetical protein
MITIADLFSPALTIGHFKHIHDRCSWNSKMYLTMYRVSLVKFNSCQKLIPFLPASGTHWVSALHTHDVLSKSLCHETISEKCITQMLHVVQKGPTTTKVNLNLVYVVPVPGRKKILNCSGAEPASYSVCTGDSFNGTTKHLGCEAAPFTSIQH